MKIAHLVRNVKFDPERPQLSVLLETEFSREIRIVLKSGQIMKEHSTPYPIVVELVKGAVRFTSRDSTQFLEYGDMISLPGGVPHDLEASQDSIIRLTISRSDSTKRVENVLND